MSSLWLAVAFEAIGALCLLWALIGHRSRSPFSVGSGLQPWRPFLKRVHLAAVGAGLMIAGLIIVYVELFSPARSIP